MDHLQIATACNTVTGEVYDRFSGPNLRTAGAEPIICTASEATGPLGLTAPAIVLRAKRELERLLTNGSCYSEFGAKLCQLPSKDRSYLHVAQMIRASLLASAMVARFIPLRCWISSAHVRSRSRGRLPEA